MVFEEKVKRKDTVSVGWIYTSESKVMAIDASPPVSPVLEARHRNIARLVTQQGSIRVADLSRRFGVSEVTIRGDLERLSRCGLIIRFRGGAVARSETAGSSSFGERAQVRADEKERMAAKAVEMVSPGDSVLLDAGTTVMELAQRLTGITPLTVVTNAINIAGLLTGRPGVHVMLAGGSVTPETLSTIGALAERDIADLLVDTLFLGCHALDPKLGIVDVSVEVARVKQAMVSAARKVVLMADSSKFHERSLAKVASLDAAHVLITDTGLSDELAESIRAQGLEVFRV
jgi:DeoR/GlpR family transcriptional regulator of sugar metabolism